jgi:uncharacterized coiled-coil DUF342 family protein
MSSMAKVFVVLNLILVLLAFGAAATLLGAQDNYKAQLEEANQKFKEFQAAQSAELRRKETELESQGQRAIQMSTERNAAIAERDQLRTSVQEAKQLVDKHAATIESLTEELKGLRATIDQLRGLVDAATKRADEDTSRANNLKAQLDAEVQNRVRLEAEVVRASEESRELSTKLAQVEKELRDANFWLGEYRTRYGPIAPGMGAEGVVKSVGKTGLVAISVGSSAGVKMGDEYQISRGDRFVCTIRIIEVQPQLSVGRVVEGTQTDAFPPQANDRAWTR